MRAVTRATGPRRKGRVRICLPTSVRPCKIVIVVGGADESVASGADESEGTLRGEVSLRVVAVDGPQARDLQDRQIAEMAERYGGGGPAPLHGEEFEPPEGCFILGTVEGTARACGG